jgi:PKD repeat protein
LGAEVDHIYQKAGNWKVKLTVKDGKYEDTDETSVKIIPANKVPVGVIKIDADSWKDIDNKEVYTNVNIVFDASESYDPDGYAYLDDLLETSPLDDLYQLTWDMGDGTIYTEQAKVTHSYPDNGTFEVKIFFQDRKEAAFNETYTIEVANRLPFAVIKETKITYEMEEQPVMLSGDGSYDLDGEVIGYYWDFGDGTHSDESKGIDGYQPSKVTSHQYERAGRYTATLYVMDNDGERATGDKVATVEVLIKAPESDPTPFPTGMVLGGIAAFAGLLAVASSLFVGLRKRT